MVRLNGNQMREKLNQTVHVYCRQERRDEKKITNRKNGKVS